VDGEVGKEGEGGRPVGIVERVGSLAQGQPLEPAALRVREEGEAGAEPGPEGGLASIAGGWEGPKDQVNSGSRRLLGISLAPDAASRAADCGGAGGSGVHISALP
jgi:hypothetical protein